nr:MAG TPA: mannose-6-phosphate receptor [Caudoviricetes sp.]
MILMVIFNGGSLLLVTLIVLVLAYWIGGRK